MNDLLKSKPLMWSLLAAFVVATLYATGYRTLVPPDEGRYAEMAREMLASGDWITTRLNGLKYFEKPPLQTWMNALSFAAFGLGEWQARLWTALCGIAGVLLTGFTARRVFDARAGSYAALVLGSSLYWIASGQINSLDMSLSAMMTLSLCVLLLAQRDGADDMVRRRWMLVCWAGMALAVLAKGLIGVLLPGAVLVLYTLVTRDWALWRRLHLGLGLAVFFAIAAPWFVLVGLRNPEQPHFFFVHEHFERFLERGHHREGPWYYFLPLLVVGMMPWLVLLPQSVAAALRTPRGAHFRPALLLVIWAVFIFTFFSFSHSKLPGYILPIFPALAMLVALYLARAARGQFVLCGAALATLGAATLIALPLLDRVKPHHPGEFNLVQAYHPWALAAACVILAGGALAVWHGGRLRRDLAVLSLACSGFLGTHLIIAGFESYGYMRSGLALVPAIRAELRPDSVIYSVGTYEQSITFYLGRTVTLVGYTDEFSFGIAQQPEKAIPTLGEFITLWQREAAAGVRHLAIIDRDSYQHMLERGAPMRTVVRDSRRIVIATP